MLFNLCLPLGTLITNHSETSLCSPATYYHGIELKLLLVFTCNILADA